MVHSEFLDRRDTRAVRLASLVHRFLGLDTPTYQDTKWSREEILSDLQSEFPTTENSDKEEQVEATLLRYMTQFKLSLL